MEQKTPDKVNENKPLAVGEGGGVVREPAPLGQSFGAYADSSVTPMQEKTDNKSPEHAQKKDNPWEKEHKPWASTVDGRFAIRCFSRGVMGAAFFALGGYLHSKSMNLYDHSQGFSEQWNPLKRGSGGNREIISTENNPMRFMAKCIDTVVGKPIEAAFGKEAVTFRTTRAFEVPSTVGANGEIVKNFQTGRSLGNEVVSITFDFAMASIGDALGRNIAALVDPNVKKEWMKDGKVDLPQLAKDALKGTWKILSYNQGEDWAVALPYAYQMKFQRKALDGMFPGFRYDFDRQTNGASIQVDDRGQRVGDYALPGVIDLQLRFTGYNVGTLMYREAYNAIGRKFTEWKESGYKMPKIEVSSPLELMKSIDEGAGDLAKYVAKSAIKGTIFMTPSVPFFWLFRTSQSKWRGVAINPHHEVAGEDGHLYQKGGVISELDRDPQHRNFGRELHARTLGDTLGDNPEQDAIVRRNISERVAFSSTPASIGQSYGVGDIRMSAHNVSDPFFNPAINNPDIKNDANKRGVQRNAFSITGGVVDEMLNLPGKISNIPAEVLEYAVVENLAGKTDDGKKGYQMTRKDASKLNRDYFNAAFSYTPYMFAKAEFANAWDNAHMDMAIYEALDGLFSGKKEQFKTGLREVGLAIRKQLPEKKEWRDLVKQDMAANRKVDIQSMSQSELGPDLRNYRARQRSGNWKQEEELKRATSNEPTQGNTIH